jgi:hypothetical protein
MIQILFIMDLNLDVILTKSCLLFTLFHFQHHVLNIKRMDKFTVTLLKSGQIGCTSNKKIKLYFNNL